MIQPKILENDEIIELTDLVNTYFFKPYAGYPQLNQEALSDYYLSELQKTLAGTGNSIIALQENGTYHAFCVLKKSEVESEILRKQVFCLPALVSTGTYHTALNNKLKLLGFLISDLPGNPDMISCRADTSDLSTIHALEKQCFRYMEGLVTYSFEMPQKKPGTVNTGFTVRQSKKEDLGQLKKIAQTSFSLDRFHNDPHIEKTESDRIYAQFIENAARGIGADRVMVALNNDAVIGFNTIEVQNRLLAQSGIRIGCFVLNAVSSDYRNRGVYSALIHESLISLNEMTDIVEIRVHAQNYPSHRALSKLGFTHILSQVTFHHWITRDTPAEYTTGVK